MPDSILRQGQATKIENTRTAIRQANPNSPPTYYNAVSLGANNVTLMPCSAYRLQNNTGSSNICLSYEEGVGIYTYEPRSPAEELEKLKDFGHIRQKLEVPLILEIDNRRTNPKTQEPFSYYVINAGANANDTAVRKINNPEGYTLTNEEKKGVFVTQNPTKSLKQKTRTFKNLFNQLDHSDYIANAVTVDTTSPSHRPLNIEPTLKYNVAEDYIMLNGVKCDGFQAHALTVFAQHTDPQSGQPYHKPNHIVPVISLMDATGAHQSTTYDYSSMLKKLHKCAKDTNKKIVFLANKIEDDDSTATFSITDNTGTRPITPAEINALDPQNVILAVATINDIYTTANDYKRATQNRAPMPPVLRDSAIGIERLLQKLNGYSDESAVHKENCPTLKNTGKSANNNPDPNANSVVFCHPYKDGTDPTNRKETVLKDIQMEIIRIKTENPSCISANNVPYYMPFPIGIMNHNFPSSDPERHQRFSKIEKRQEYVHGVLQKHSSDIHKDIIFITTKHDNKGRYVPNSDLEYYLISGNKAIKKITDSNNAPSANNALMILDSPLIDAQKTHLRPRSGSTTGELEEFRLSQEEIFRNIVISTDKSKYLPLTTNTSIENTQPPLHNTVTVDGKDSVQIGDIKKSPYFAEIANTVACSKTADIPIIHIVETESPDTPAKITAVNNKLKEAARASNYTLISIQKGSGATPIQYYKITPKGTITEITDFKRETELYPLIHCNDKSLLSDAVKNNADFKKYITQNISIAFLPSQVKDNPSVKEFKDKQKKKEEHAKKISEIKQEIKQKEDDYIERTTYKNPQVKTTPRKVITQDSLPKSQTRIYKQGGNKLLYKGNQLKHLDASTISIKDKSTDKTESIAYTWPSPKDKYTSSTLMEKLQKDAKKLNGSFILVKTTDDGETEFYHINERGNSKVDPNIGHEGILIFESIDAIDNIMEQEVMTKFLRKFKSPISFVSIPNDKMTSQKSLKAKMSDSALWKDRYSTLNKKGKAFRIATSFLSLGILPLIGRKYQKDIEISYQKNEPNTRAGHAASSDRDFQIRCLKMASIDDPQWKAQNESISKLLNSKKAKILNEEDLSLVRFLLGQTDFIHDRKFFKLPHYLLLPIPLLITAPITKSVLWTTKLAKFMQDKRVPGGKGLYNFLEWIANKVSSLQSIEFAKALRKKSYEMEYNKKMKQLCAGEDKPEEIRKAYELLQKKQIERDNIKDKLHEKKLELLNKYDNLNKSYIKESKDLLENTKEDILQCKEDIKEYKQELKSVKKAIHKIQKTSLTTQDKLSKHYAKKNASTCTAGRLSLAKRQIEPELSPNMSGYEPAEDLMEPLHHKEISINEKKLDLISTGQKPADSPKFTHLSDGDITPEIKKELAEYAKEKKSIEDTSSTPFTPPPLQRRHSDIGLPKNPPVA